MYHDNHELIRRQTSKRHESVEVQKPDVPFIVITNVTNYYTDTNGKTYKGAYRDGAHQWFYKDENGKTVKCPDNTNIIGSW